MSPIASAQERIARTLTVTGRGVENIQTSIALVRLGVEVQGKTAQEVQAEVARRSSAVVTLLRSRNVDKLETTGIRLNPVYSYTNNVQRIEGYQASNIVSFRIGNDRAGNLLDEAVKAGATRIDGVSFVASDEAIKTAQKQALREATEDAQQQADAVFQTLKLTRREIVSIQVNGAAVPPPRPIAEFANTAKVASTPIIAGEQEVEASVTLQISY
ncbi:MAG: SIMPL domain-containing protein [Leptolyngbyaceae cyanobacterium bins.59]|nr:SIMPL domain-containing protein [Leptolyngbyaceae cyanobacterium bins.59]